MTEHQHVTIPAPRRRRLPWWAIAGALALVLAVVGTVLTEQGMERRIADRVRCHLPEGVAVGEVDISGWAPYVLATRSLDGHVDLTFEADASAVRALLSERADVSLRDGLVTVGSTVRGADVEVVVRPVVADGAVRLEPESVQVGSRTFGAGLLGGLPDLAGAGVGTVPLPAPLDAGAVTAVSVVEDHLVLDVRIPAEDLATQSSDASCA